MLDEKPISELDYEFDAVPDSGKLMQITSDLYWLRMPLPMQLAHINLWLVRDGKSWAIVDTGLFTDESRKIWENIYTDFLDEKAPSRVIVTHVHPDHAGCAGWLTERFNIDLWMSRAEFDACHLYRNADNHPIPDSVKDFYIAAGFEQEQTKYYERMFKIFGVIVSPLPQTYHCLEEGMTLPIGQHQWQVMVGRGHSPEHVCLFSEDLNIFIAGDQLLPTISSNVGVFAGEPDANPLASWLYSLSSLRDRLPQDVLVLPAHGRPFRGAHHRLTALIHEHEDALEKLEIHCKQPRRAVDTFPALFKSRITGSNLTLATAEAIAHLNYLLQQNRISMMTDENGVNWYQV